jgi:hypothetical protein
MRLPRLKTLLATFKQTLPRPAGWALSSASSLIFAQT